MLTPRLSSYWLDFVTPFPASVSRPLIEGLRSESICTSALALELFPEIRPISYEVAIAKALNRSAPSLPLPSLSPAVHQTVRAEGIICDIRQLKVDASPDRVFAVVENLGGKNGWLAFNPLWQLRGWLDRWIGGVGISRGRSRENGMEVGDVIDFWRVQWVERPQRALLRAEMKLPGAAWLQFDVGLGVPDRTLLRCCAWFQPRGLLGEIYWYALYPIHLLIFRKLVMAVRRLAESNVFQ